MNILFVKDVSKHELGEFAHELLTHLKQNVQKGATVLALSGDLGAGKTTIVQMIGRLLGVVEDITSPTFTIMKGYQTTDAVFTELIHMDAYRIETEVELRPLHFAEILNRAGTLICVEWPEHIKNALPEGTSVITLAVKDEETRTATLSV